MAKKSTDLQIMQICRFATSCRFQFIDSARFMASLLSNPVNKLAYGLKNVKRVELNTKVVNAILNIQTLKMI